MSTLLATHVQTGTRIPYHVTSAQRLPGVTADGLRGAAVRLPSGSIYQNTSRWIVRGLLKLSSDARSLLPPIMGGSAPRVDFDASVESRAVLLRAAEHSSDRQALGATLHLRSMGFAPSADDLAVRIEQGAMDIAELGGVGAALGEGPAAEGPRRGPGGRCALQG